MWHDLVFSVNTVFPLLLMMLAGLVAQKLRIIGAEGVRQANSAVFHIFLPLLLCLNIMDTEAGRAPDVRTLLYAMAGVVLSFLLMFPLARRLSPAPEARGVLIQGVARSNYAIFGIPLVLMMYPDANHSVAALMVAAVVPLFNVMATIALMMHSGRTVRLGSIVRGVLVNPLILGTLAGFVLWRLGWTFPTVLDKPLRGLAGVATPLALFLLGASLDFDKVRANARLLTVGVLGRLVAAPMVFLAGAVALGIRDVNLATLIAVFASPTAVSSYPMAQQLGGDTDFAAAQVVLTTALSGITVFLWVFAFKSMGFLT
ncbi:MAG: AEC family transporter [Clostridiales bacterium]|nr:AEC family transporter [Clostridiales bacterium]